MREMNYTKVCGIYKITSPTGKIYIGQAVNVRVRKGSYKNSQCEGQRILYNSLKKYGFEAHLFEVVHKCPKKELNKWEVHYIKEFDSFDTPHGMNLTSGGDSFEVSEETKIMQSETRRGGTLTEEHKAKIRKNASQYWLGKKLSEATKKKLKKIQNNRSEEWKRNISKGKKGRTISEQHKESISKTLIGRIFSEETIQKMRDTQKARKEYPKKKGCSSKHIGVTYNKKDKKWRAYIKLDLKEIHLGMFANEDDAGRARDIATKKYFGDRGRLNFL